LEKSIEMTNSAPDHCASGPASNPAGSAASNPASGPVLSAAYSRFAQRRYQADAALAAQVAELAHRPLTRTWMRARAAQLGLARTEKSPAELGQAGLPQPTCDEATLRRALRQLRNEVFCTLIERDLAGRADLNEVTSAMSDLAELSIQLALAVLGAELEAQFGAPQVAAESGAAPLPATLGVVGMGKLGGRELNVSSDIDLIFVYEDDGETAGASRAPISNHEYFTRLGRRLIGALADITSDGYVFRVDMRLRPNGDAGPLVCSLAMLEEYFYVQGREWERYAWIKGRMVSENETPAARRLAEQLETRVVPFVYRRYLDYGVIGAIRSLHAQIRQEAVRRALMRPEKADDVKLGRGGIREIEFSAQVYQLIRGGQDAAFRVRPTLQVLALAAARGLLARPVCEQLSEAYGFLRRVEHRLQYLDDAQTHALPVDPALRLKLAQAMGYGDYASFYQALEAHRQNVEQEFDQIFADKAETGPIETRDGSEASDFDWIWCDALGDADVPDPDPEPNPAHPADPGDAAAGNTARARREEDAVCREFNARLDAQLAQLGIADPVALRERLRATRASSRYQGLPALSKQRFNTLVQRALLIAAQGDAAGFGDRSQVSNGSGLRRDRARASPDTIIARFLDLLEAISRRGAYLALLTEYPAALTRVLAVLGASRWAAGYLNSHPQLLDELLDDEALASPFDWDAFRSLLRGRIAAADGVEQQMDLLRHAHHAEVFRILLLDLAGRLTVEVISDRLSELADAMLDVTLETVWATLPRRHRAVPRFAVIAYGKLGGKELGYASDLDIIFLYDDPDDAAAEVYATFARRLVMWLTTATGAGTLFDIDLRLRPNGASGLLVTPLEAFRSYQLREGDAANTAWVWEHQALSRARFSAGDSAIGADFEAIRTRVLGLPRDAAALAAEIVAMRTRVADGHPNRTALFDLKHDRGGMVDIEFTVQYLVLLHAGEHPSLLRNAGNITLLRECAGLGLIEASQAEAVGDAYRYYRKLQHQLRLDGVEAARVEPDTVEAQRQAVKALWAATLGRVTGAA
jgi:glutamate-ammonia-ligase adenylyltransferase